MLSIDVKITGDKEIIKKLSKLGLAMMTYKEAMGDIGEAYEDFYGNAVIKSQGGIIGVKWKPLSTKYKKFKTKNYNAATQLLVASGKMKKSFGHEADSKSVTIYNDDPKFAYHNSDEPRSKMPRRQIFKVNDAVRKIAQDIMDADVNKKIKRAGL